MHSRMLYFDIVLNVSYESFTGLFISIALFKRESFFSDSRVKSEALWAYQIICRKSINKLPTSSKIIVLRIFLEVKHMLITNK